MSYIRYGMNFFESHGIIFVFETKIVEYKGDFHWRNISAKMNGQVFEETQTKRTDMVNKKFWSKQKHKALAELNKNDANGSRKRTGLLSPTLCSALGSWPKSGEGETQENAPLCLQLKHVLLGRLQLVIYPRRRFKTRPEQTEIKVVKLLRLKKSRKGIMLY